MSVFRHHQRYNLFITLFTIALFGAVQGAVAAQKATDQAPGRVMARQATKAPRIWITADHSKHKELQREFRNGKQITQACLACHSEAEAQFHKSIHWTWLAPDSNRQVGKAGYSLNNFCISTNKTKDKSCLACHPGWGTSTESVNCLACHGRQDINWDEAFEDMQYFSEADDEESKEMARELQTEIQQAVQKVGRPTRKNCGACHFYGGGGDGVKHGDLDTSLAKPNKALDVHMGTDGQNFDCVRCHTTKLHNIAGRVYTAPAATDRKSLIEDDLASKITCESCHGSAPHKSDFKANDHTDKVACQSCHIPKFARVNPTKMSWDWSQAGKKKDGKPFKTKDSYGKYDYMSIKGRMKWDKNVKPEYFWYNGSIKSVSAKDIIDPGRVVAVSQPVGHPEDENARIYPFKVHRGMQPYDKVNKTLLVPLLSGDNGYWKTLDWNRALSKGQQAVDLPFSGEYDFVQTSYVFPTTHMVAPKKNVVGCSECHVKKGSRLVGLNGFYMPGRDSSRLLDSLGWILVLGSLLGVMFHGLGRIFTNGNGRKED
jgi:octaheme c-type cytochrome (tetrathionate reductase family)